MDTSGRRSTGLLVTLIASIVLIVAACSGSASQILSTVGGPIEGDAGAAMTAGPVAAPGSNDSRSASGGGSSTDNAPAALRDDLKIVYTGSLQLVVDDLQPALARAKAAVTAAGGYVGASQESNDGDRPVATITYRIPASRWEDTIDTLRGLATKVVAEETQAAEVGSQIVDLDARIKNLRASEAALQDIAKGAGKISDLIEVQAQLTDVRGQIEQLDAQRTQLNDQVSYGTLVTTFGLEVVAVQETAKGWDPSKDVDSATATLIGLGQTVVSAGIWFAIVWLPIILLVLVVAVVMRWLFRRFAPRPRGGDPIAGWDTGA
jgi:Domain of unknown function (DUF4349)